MVSRKNIPCIEQLDRRVCLAAATINFNDVRQSVDGFGASTAWSSTAIPQAALDQLYSPTTGAGLSLHRSRIGPNGSTSETTILQQLSPYGVNTWSTPWTPPREWKTNHDNNHGGTLDPSHYQDYANLLADYVQRMAARGITISAVSLQNEPDMNVSYESCLWTDTQLAAFLPFVGQTFSSKGITSKIILPENSGWEFERANIILADPALSQYVGIVAAHNYNRTFAPFTLVNGNGNIPVWETEVYFSQSGTTEIGSAVTLAQDIQTAFKVGGVSAYHYWWVKSASDQLMTNSYIPTKRLWSMGQFSKFIRPGWVLTGETDDGGVTIASFKDPVSGKFAIVAANATATSITESYTLSGITASKVTPFITSATTGDDLKQYADITVSGGSFSGTIASNSIVTYYGQSSTAPSLIAPTNLRVTPQYSFQTTRMALAWDDSSTGETNYTVERSLNGSTWTVLTSALAADTTTYVDTTCSESTLYYYRVKATNGASPSSYSNVDSNSTVLDAPTSLNGTTITNGRNLTWTINSTASTGVVLERSLDGLLFSPIATFSTRATSYSDVIPGYNANRIYYYRVKNTKGSVVSGNAFYNTGLKTPTSFAASNVSPTSIVFSWINNAVGASGAVIEQFNSATSTWSSVTDSDVQATDGAYTLTGLTENTSYTFRFKVMSQADSLSSSYTSNLVTTTPIAQATDLTAVSTGASSAQLTWTSNSTVETAYTVERSTDGTTWTVLSSALAANSASYTDTTAPSGTVYYRAKATVSAASSAYIRTQLVAALPIITASPTPVTGITSTLSIPALSGFGTGLLNYTWSLDGTPPAAVTYSTNGTNTSNSSIATFTAAGSYTFRIRISDVTGNTTTSTKIVIVNQTLTSITVEPTSSQPFAGGAEVATPPIAKSTWQQLVATGLDQFGTILTTQPTFTWSVVSGGGSVSATGLYTAPSTATSPMVRATSGLMNGQATLSVLTTAQLKAVYSFNETSGYNLADPVASSITAKMSGTASLVTGRLGGAVNFTGSESSVYIGTQSAIDIRGQITMAAWIKPQSSSATQIIVGRTYGNWPRQGGTYLALRGGKYAVGFFNGGQNYASFTIPAGDINTWVHLVGTYDGQTWRLYRNGTQVATMTNSTGAVYSYKAWRVGSSDNPSEYFSGTIDSIRLYSQSLSASEISALYAQTIFITTTASASPASVIGTTTNLSVAAIDPDSNSDSRFTYTWSLTGTPPAAVNYSANGTNSAKNTTATFTKAGTYNFLVTITDSGGATTTSSVSVVVNIPNLTGSISGQVYEDRNSNSLLDSGEPTLNSVTIYLDTNNNSALDVGEIATVTSGSGNYTFSNLSAGSYNVRQILPSGYLAISSPATVALTAGANLTGKNFADLPTIFNGTVGNDTYTLRTNGLNFEIVINGLLTYTVAQSLIAGFTFNGGSGTDTFQMQGNSTIDAMSLSSATTISRGGKTFTRSRFENLVLQSGAYSISADLNLLGLNITNAIATFTQTQTLGSLSLTGGALVTSASNNALAPAMNIGGVTIDNSILSIAVNGGLSGVSQFTSLNLIGTGKLELHNNDLVINYGNSASPYDTLLTKLLNGLTVLGGSGISGITSSEVDNQTIAGTMIAIIDDGDPLVGGAITSTSGFTITNPTQSVILKYTWFGDSTLDGQVDGSDYALIDTGYTSGGSLSGWDFGDYDYSNTVDGSDYALIDTGFMAQNSIL